MERYLRNLGLNLSSSRFRLVECRIQHGYDNHGQQGGKQQAGDNGHGHGHEEAVEQQWNQAQRGGGCRH